MTDSTMLKAAAVGKLMDIQDVCNRIIAENRDRESLAAARVEMVAHEILDIIKRP